MGTLLQVVGRLHRATRRDYLARMTDDKVHCSRVARRFGPDYWDGDRRYGYGGYRYDGRWLTVAQHLADFYALSPAARILDVGCGRGFLLYEFTRLLPDCTVVGTDVSDYALATAHEGVRSALVRHDARTPLPFPDAAFDLVVSVNTLHNLTPPQAVHALAEIQRVGRRAFVVVESYRDEAELFHLQCWALTCETFLRPEGWQWLFGLAGYTGDYEFIYFE